jgi:hypothetical protein
MQQHDQRIMAGAHFVRALGAQPCGVAPREDELAQALQGDEPQDQRR